ncbi:MAG: nuclear transport factor 2 family protein [Candidatus Acidiferrales bacterium]
MADDLAARITQLEAQVRELNDRERIRDLRYRYHEYVNEGKGADIAALFTADGAIDFGHLGKAQGHDQIARFFRGIKDLAPEQQLEAVPRITWIKQFIHNHVVEVHGDQARGFAYLEAKPIFNGEAYLVAARYDDEYVRSGAGWKFARMSLVPYFMVPLREGWAQRDRLKMRPS